MLLIVVGGKRRRRERVSERSKSNLQEYTANPVAFVLPPGRGGCHMTSNPTIL